MKNEEKLLETICVAYEDALRNTHMRFSVIYSSFSGEVYVFSDSAGSNTLPVTVWNGFEVEVCRFCFQFWSPEDADDDFRSNFLYNYLIDSQRELLESDDQEYPNSVVISMYPNEYQDYCEDVISFLISEFDPKFYLKEDLL